MKIDVEKFDNYTELIIHGRLDTNTSPELQTVITGIIEKGAENILINFAALDYISSSGLRVFLIAAKMLDAKGKKLNFCEMKDFIREVFDIAGFSILFNIYNTRDGFGI